MSFDSSRLSLQGRLFKDDICIQSPRDKARDRRQRTMGKDSVVSVFSVLISEPSLLAQADQTYERI